MDITFCDFNYNGAYEYSLNWNVIENGYGWEVLQDGILIATYILHDRTWTFTKLGEIHPALEDRIISEMKSFESLGPMRYKQLRGIQPDE